MRASTRPANLLFGALSLATVVLVIMLVAGTFAADRTATAFFAAVRAGRIEDASRLATPELRPALRVLTGEPPVHADDDRGRTLLRARTAGTNELEHYGGGLRELCGHVVGASEGAPMWVMLHKMDGIWLVADLGSRPPPPACVSSGTSAPSSK